VNYAPENRGLFVFQKIGGVCTMTMQTYTIEQVAKILQVRKNFVYDLVYKGRLKSLRLSERRFRISESALLEFMKQEEAAQVENVSTYGGLQSAGEVDM